MLERLSVDQAVDLARDLIAELEIRRSVGPGSAAPARDPKLERRIALELGGEQLVDLAERRRAADDRAKKARRNTIGTSSPVTFASARLYGEARRQDADAKRAVQRARQARAKFQLVYATIVASDAFAERLQAERAAADPSFGESLAIDAAVAGLEAVIDAWLSRKAGGKPWVEIDQWMLRDMDPYDAARKLVALANEASETEAA